MFERFTDRARKVLALANQEAQRFNHTYIGTEHILLGLVKEGAGTAARVLEGLGIDLAKTRVEVERLVGVGPDQVTYTRLPQTLVAKAALERAVQEARGMNHHYVGTEHLLLGLMDVEGVARRVLVNFGVDFGRVREAVLEMTTAAEVLAPAEGKVAPAGDVWMGKYVSVAVGESLLAKIREEGKRRSAEAGREISEADVIRVVLEERFGRD